MDKIKLFILDDHQMLIDGLKALLKSEKQFDLVGEANNAKDALDLIDSLVPDIVLTDIHMPEMSGIEFTRIVKEKHPHLKVLALSMFGTKEMISEMLEAGVSGYVLKNTGKQELVDALTKIAAGGMFFSDEVSAEMIRVINEKNHKRPEETVIHLTDREKEIVRLIAREFNNAQIADQLFISERTVESHRKNIFRKTNTKGLIGLMRYAMAHKIIE